METQTQDMTPDHKKTLGEPAPATAREWTVRQWKERQSFDVMQDDKLICGDLLPFEASSLVNAHNAALAAERELRADWNYVIEELERKNKELTEDNEQAQLCAQGVINMQQEIVQLREQLDAAVEVLETLIFEFHDDSKPRNEAIGKAAALIDKIGEGK